MFGTLGGPELFLIFVIALIVFGPRKLPEIGKNLGKMMSEFRRASNDLKRTLEEVVEAERYSPHASQAALPPLPEPVPPAAQEAVDPSWVDPQAAPEAEPSAMGHDASPSGPHAESAKPHAEHVETPHPHHEHTD
jgi:TatA/E family protein of Tat protein translocase